MPVPTTWEQLESDAKTIQAKAGIKYGFVSEGASYEGLTCNFMEYLTDAGGTVTNAGYSSARSAPRPLSRPPRSCAA